MSVAVGEAGVHPVLAALAVIDAALADCAEAPTWSLPDPELTELALAAHRSVARAERLLLRLVAEVDSRGAATSQGATSTTAWLRAAGRVRPGQARGMVGTARALAGRLAATDAALGAGALSAEQAGVIVRAVGALPRDAEAWVLGRAEAELIEAAAVHDPVELARLGRRILEVIDPDGADEALARALAREEARLAREQFLSLTPNGRGATAVRGTLDAVTAAAVRAALDPLAAPRPAAADGPDSRSPQRRLADALGEACRRLLHDGGLPSSGTEKPQVVVTVSLDTLRSGLGTATLGPCGEPISAAAARALACDAGLIPAVLGSVSQPLDLGRRVRLFDGPLRRALELRDGGCAFPGCDRPPRWCTGHHIEGWWARHGHTKLDNGVLLCGHHHRLIHQGHWAVRTGAHGHPEFIPPTWIDPTRTPNATDDDPPDAESVGSGLPQRRSPKGHDD